MIRGLVVQHKKFVWYVICDIVYRRSRKLAHNGASEIDNWPFHMWQQREFINHRTLTELKYLESRHPFLIIGKAKGKNIKKNRYKTKHWGPLSLSSRRTCGGVRFVLMRIEGIIREALIRTNESRWWALMRTHGKIKLVPIRPSGNWYQHDVVVEKDTW